MHSDWNIWSVTVKWMNKHMQQDNGRKSRLQGAEFHERVLWKRFSMPSLWVSFRNSKFASFPISWELLSADDSDSRSSETSSESLAHNSGWISPACLLCNIRHDDIYAQCCHGMWHCVCHGVCVCARASRCARVGARARVYQCVCNVICDET